MKMMVNKIVLITLSVLLFIGCEKEIDKHYERPDWLKGSAYEVLQNRGGFSKFLQAAERAGYKDLLDGKALCTVFAPDDEKFMRYLSAIGISSVETADVEQLKIIVGYHIMQYSYKKTDLLDFQISGSASTAPAGLCYKQKTFAKKAIVDITDPITGKKLPVYRKELFLPALSTKLFETKKCSDYKYNYNYFFPESKWYGDDDKVYVANAGILEYEIPTDNGYLYVIDNAIQPLNTIYEVLEQHTDKYSFFQKVYDKFADIQYSKQYTDKYAAAGDSLFLYYHHKTLPKISAEWTYNNEANQLDYQHMGPLTSSSFTAIVPNDDAMKRYFGEGGYFGMYSDFDNIPHMALNYFLRAHVFNKNIILPEDFKKGIYSEFGDQYQFNPDQDVDYREMCGNGTFYGVKDVVVPAPFKTVTGPLFQNPRYSMFAYIMENAREIVQLINMDNRYTLFIPTDETLAEMGYTLDMGNAKIYGDEKLKKPGIDNMIDVSVGEMQTLVATHIVPQEITRSEIAQGRKYFNAKQLYNYVITDEGNIVTQGNGGYVKITKDLGEWANGKAYEVESVLTPVSKNLYLQLKGDNRFREFFKLLKKAELVDTVNYTIPCIAGEMAMVFAPSNTAITNGLAADVFPSDKVKLANYLKYYFVAVEANGITGYVLPGLNGSWVCNTKLEAEIINNQITYRKLKIDQFDDKQLQVSTVSTVPVTTKTTVEFPVFASDGVIYNLESVLELDDVNI